jgi:hypothetical protein
MFPETGAAKSGLRGELNSGRHGGNAAIGANILSPALIQFVALMTQEVLPQDSFTVLRQTKKIGPGLPILL